MARAPIKTLPSVEELNRLFAYSAETGELTWKVLNPRAHMVKVGDCAGTITKRGYLQVFIRPKQYLVHRIIWKIMTGSDPVDQVDHIDGDRINNRWANLRAADNGENRWNSKIPKNNKSGVKGVCREHGRAWVAYINRQRLGRFKSKQEAIDVRMAAALKQHGEFLRLE